MIFILIGIDINWVNGGLSNADFKENLLVEAHGVLGDLLIFGVILSIYDTIRTNKEDEKRKSLEREKKIESIKEVIDDFRGWESEEARYRVLGCIKRLHKLNCYEIDLSQCYLINSKFSNMKFHKTSFNHANLNGSTFSESQINNCEFNNSDLVGVLFNEAEITSETDMFVARLNGFMFTDKNFISKLDEKTKKGINQIYVILNFSEYYNTHLQGINLFEMALKSDFSKIEYYFFIRKDEAIEYKKKNKRIIKE